MFPGVAFAVEEFYKWIQVWLQELQWLWGVLWELAPLIFFSKRGKNTSTVVLPSTGALTAAWQTSSATHNSKENVFASLGAGPQPGMSLGEADGAHWEQILRQEKNSGKSWWCPLGTKP